MTVMLLTLAIFAALMGGMAVGVIFGNKPLRGSCGGVGGGSCACEEAGKPGACKLPEGSEGFAGLSSRGSAPEFEPSRGSAPEFRPPGALMALRKR